MDVSTWLRDLGLEDYVQAFQANHIDAEVLPRLTADDLIAIGITSVGHCRRLLDAIALLRGDATPASAEPTEETIRPGQAERRQLTVLFVDLVGSTALAARLDPEDMGAVIRAYHGACAATVEYWGGHIAKYMGDGVLAYFGWPLAHEDEAERAVRAGLAIIAALAGLETPAGEPLAARVGIATGLVMVGELIGEGAAKEQTVVGETPNLAARLQDLATPGSVVISQATRRRVGELFELADLGPLNVKGFAKPLPAWRVDGEGRLPPGRRAPGARPRRRRHPRRVGLMAAAAPPAQFATHLASRVPVATARSMSRSSACMSARSERAMVAASFMRGPFGRRIEGDQQRKSASGLSQAAAQRHAGGGRQPEAAREDERQLQHCGQ